MENGDGEDTAEWGLDWLLYLEKGALHGVIIHAYATPGRTPQVDCVQRPSCCKAAVKTK